jgi:hypothetical protein
MRKQEATRLQQTADPVARADIRGVIAMFDRRIAKIEARMTDLVTADPERVRMASRDDEASFPKVAIKKPTADCPCLSSLPASS